VKIQAGLAMTNDEIIEFAARIVSAGDDEEKLRALDPEWNRLDRNETEEMLMMIAYKLLQGEAYGICSNRPKHVERCRALAMAMGASVSSTTSWAPLPDRQDFQSLVFKPAPTQ
jgi:hypothetical protein